MINLNKGNFSRRSRINLLPLLVSVSISRTRRTIISARGRETKMYIYIYTSTHRGKRHKVAGTKRRDDRFSFLLDRSPHCRSSRLDRCEFKAFHAITHIGQFAYGICLSTHWTVNRMTYSAIRRHVIIHRGTCFFSPDFIGQDQRVDNLSIETRVQSIVRN